MRQRKTRQRIRLSQKRRRAASPLALVSVGVTLLIVLSAGVIFMVSRVLSHADQLNMDCTLLVPANPLTVQGLATPYQLSATNAANGACNEANANQSAFVQGVIYNPATGAFSVYNPLIIDANTQPAIAPTVPMMPQGAVVGLWFGFNGANLTLKGAQNNTLNRARCVNGQRNSVFGQFAYCNAPAFFAAANMGIAAGKVKVPTLQMAMDGKPCPTVRDFSVVDQDQSDNVQTEYLANANGQTAQFSTANQGQLQNATVLANPSDNALVTNFIDPALGCQPWQAPDLANNNTPTAALPLDEIQAAVDQKAPIALVPITNPMTLNNNNPSLGKTNLYRIGVDQMPAANQNQASGTIYCQNLVNVGLPRLQLDKPLTVNAASPAADVANSLFTFLAQRFMQSYVNLNCQALLNKPNPVTVQTDDNGVAISATFGNANSNGQGNNGGATQAVQGGAMFNLETNEKSVGIALKFTYPNQTNTNVDVQVRTDSRAGNVIFT